MSKNTRKIEKAIELVEQARVLIDSVMTDDKNGLKDYQIASEYYTYGEWGLKQAVGEGNQLDGKLQDIIYKLEEENL